MMNAPAFPAAAIAGVRDAAKAYLRILGEEEDALVERLAASALALAEAFTGKVLIAREWRESVPAASVWRRLSAEPVATITDVGGLAAGRFGVDIDGDGVGWVRVTGAPAANGVPGGRVTVTFQAGAADWNSLAPAMAQGVVLLVAHLFENRGGEAPPAAVAALWRPYRRVRLRMAERVA